MGHLPPKDRKARKEFLADLRKGSPDESDAVGVLSTFVIGHHDQQLEKAALARLAKHGTPDALLGVARRAIDTWGVGVITRANELCGKMQHQGGLLVLSSTLFFDDRFIADKLDAMKGALSLCGDELSLKKLESLPDISELHAEPKSVNTWRLGLSHISSLDIREGIVFGSQYEGTVGYIGRIPGEFKGDEIQRAAQYVERRIPGISGLFNENLNWLSG